MARGVLAEGYLLHARSNLADVRVLCPPSPFCPCVPPPSTPSRPPARPWVISQALLKPFQHTSLKEAHYSRQLYDMANNL